MLVSVGARAPVVISVTPSNGNCANAARSVDHGSVLHHQRSAERNIGIRDRSSERSDQNKCDNFVIIDANLIDALFNFSSAKQARRS